MFIAALIISILGLVASVVMFVMGKSKMKDSTAKNTFTGLFVMSLLFEIALPIFALF